MDEETILATIIIAYFVGVFALMAMIVHQGVTGKWSKDDWPVFAIIAPWVWPFIIPAALFEFYEHSIYPRIRKRREAKIHHG